MTTAERLTRPVRLLAVALALLAGVTAGTVPSASYAADSCDGVWVVVDATRLGGAVRTFCAPGSPSSGLDALRLAGVSYTFLERQPGLVCTLNGHPDPCNGAPTDAYWGYWHAEAGGEWVYSTRGAGNRTPAKGTVEGWAFGAGQPPGRTPPATAPPKAEPEPSPTATATAAPEPETSASDAPTASGGAEDDTQEGGNSTAAPDAATDAGEDATSDADPTPGAADTRPADNSSADDADARADRDPVAEATDGDGVRDEPVVAPGDVVDEDGRDEAASPSSDDEVPDDEVALGDVAGDGGGGAPVGAIAGGVLVAGLAGAGVLRARRRGDLGER